jgi:hypothetical protein
MHILETEEPSGRRVVTLALSERNLLGLLAKIHDPLSQRTLVRFSDDGSLAFVVRADADDAHYDGRTPGSMHPRTEAALRSRS